MRLRTLHFACLLALLTVLGGVDAAALPLGAATQARSAIHLRTVDDAQSVAAVSSNRKSAVIALPSAARTHHAAVWTMMPPAAHSADVHAVTSSGL